MASRLQKANTQEHIKHKKAEGDAKQDGPMPFPGFQLSHFLPHSFQPFNGQLEPLSLIIVLFCHCGLLVPVDLPDLASRDWVYIHVQGQVCHGAGSCADVAGLIVVADKARRC